VELLVPVGQPQQAVLREPVKQAGLVSAVLAHRLSRRTHLPVLLVSAVLRRSHLQEKLRLVSPESARFPVLLYSVRQVPILYWLFSLLSFCFPSECHSRHIMCRVSSDNISLVSELINVTDTVRLCAQKMPSKKVVAPSALKQKVL
jgi:hypothetical protein